ncbi:hypothetical protein GCM10010441_33350 [Kitasatospora paracochleata]|uniref:DUF1023 domain-containing protein n=1 Tax=Kitasatospora paracochleata TaxID=58354 RepID=A0ABT1IPK3_9ACTN|nr:alpha/beta hydrolase [Kitasatospora paracochleata]MCP2307053.1 hypothetical protein [Kitasatospora paracochleata]
MDHATLLAADPPRLAAAADACARLVDALESHHADWARDTADRLTASGWYGAAADLAVPAVRRATGRLEAAALELSLLRDVLHEAADVFRLAQASCPAPRLPGLPAAAAPDSPWTAPSTPTAPAGADDEDARRAAALAEADHADRTTAERLSRLTASLRDGRALAAGRAAALAFRLASRTDGLGSLLAAALPAPGTPPDRVAAWWRGLDPAGRRELADAQPELIGRLDGLPAAVRDRANRLVLDRLLARPDGLSGPVLDGLRSIHERLAAGPADVLLLDLDPTGRGRGVLSFGDPDLADHVAVYVPGFGTELAAVGRGDADRAQRLRAAGERCADGRTVAAVVWLGYDAPPNEGLDPRSAQVADDGRARAGAAAYGRFLDGLQAARPGGAAHVTAVGHSYGSLVVGLAAGAARGPLADEVVLVGSPGVGADRADRLGVGAGHVHVGAAEYDPVSHLPSGAGAAGGLLVGGLPGLAVHAVGATGPHELWFGEDPASAGFGAHRFHVAPGDPGHAFASHSAYFEGESLDNIAHVVAGRPDLVTPDRPR